MAQQSKQTSKLEKELKAEIEYLEASLQRAKEELVPGNLDAVFVIWRGIQQSANKGFRKLVELAS